MADAAVAGETAGTDTRVAAASSAIATAASTISARAGETIERAKDAGAATAAAATGWADDIRTQIPDADALRAVGRRGSERLAAQVREQPFETVLLGAALGYLAAWIIHRR